MKIVHYTTHFGVGGAGQALARLHQGLIASGHHSSVRFLHGRPQREETSPADPSEMKFSVDRSTWTRLRGRLRTDWTSRLNADRQTRSSLFSDRSTPVIRGMYQGAESADVVQLNWISQFVSLADLFKAVPQTPIVWRLPDLNPLTGGCHYSLGCQQMMTGCRACPQLRSSASQARVEQNWLSRERVFKSIATNQLHLIAQSRWVADLLQRHPLLNRFQRTVIRNGIDRDQFTPLDKTVARSRLRAEHPTHRMDDRGLLEANSVGLVFAGPGDARKSTDELIEVLLPQLGPEQRLIVVGRCDDDRVNRHASIIRLKPMSRNQLPLLYSAADVMLFPHREDNCPNTVLESQACGTPVCGFDHSGVRELIQPNINGRLFPDGDFVALADALLKFDRQTLAPPGEIADTVWPMQKTIDSYVSFYTQVIGMSKNA